MTIIPRQIGWSQESNLLWQILRQMDQLTKVTSTSGGGAPSLTATQIAFGDGSNLMTGSSNFAYDITGAGAFVVGFGSGANLTIAPDADFFGFGDVSNHGDGGLININSATGIAYYSNLATNGKFGINTNSPSVALDVVGDVKLGIIADDTYLTIDNVIKEIKLNVSDGGLISAADVKGIALDGVNDSYKFGNTQTVALEIFGNPGSGQSFKTLFNGNIYGFNADLTAGHGHIAVGDISGVISASHTNLIIDPAYREFYFSDQPHGDYMFLYGYDNGNFCVLNLGDLGVYNDTNIKINSNTSNNLIEINSPSGNYKFNNVPTFATNTAALAGGLTVGNIYQLGGTLGSASLLSIVY